MPVQWLGLGAFTTMALVQSLVEELKSRKPHGTTGKKKRVGRDSGGLGMMVRKEL